LIFKVEPYFRHFAAEADRLHEELKRLDDPQVPPPLIKPARPSAPKAPPAASPPPGSPITHRSSYRSLANSGIARGVRHREQHHPRGTGDAFLMLATPRIRVDRVDVPHTLRERSAKIPARRASAPRRRRPVAARPS
jgi:hypothetical protein